MKKILLISFLVFSGNVFSQSFSIVEGANELCGEIEREGFNEKTKISGSVKVKLENILKKIGIDAGVEGVTDYELEKYSGVLQKDLAGSIEQGNKCKLEALKLLKEYSLQVKNIESVENTKKSNKEEKIVECRAKLKCNARVYKNMKMCLDTAREVGMERGASDAELWRVERKCYESTSKSAKKCYQDEDVISARTLCETITNSKASDY